MTDLSGIKAIKYYKKNSLFLFNYLQTYQKPEINSSQNRSDVSLKGVSNNYYAI